MHYPLMAEQSLGNVFGEHVFKLRTTVGAASAVSYRSLSATIAKLDVGKWRITLPQSYKEVTDFSCGWKRADTQVPLVLQIVADNVATDGTLDVEALDPLGAATAPQNGDVMFITIGVSQDVQNEAYKGTG